MHSVNTPPPAPPPLPAAPSTPPAAAAPPQAHPAPAPPPRPPPQPAAAEPWEAASMGGQAGRPGEQRGRRPGCQGALVRAEERRATEFNACSAATRRASRAPAAAGKTGAACSRPATVLAGRRTWMLPPTSSSSRPAAISCCRTFSGWACGASHLVMAATMGQPAARAWEMASRVCRGGVRQSRMALAGMAVHGACRHGHASHALHDAIAGSGCQQAHSRWPPAATRNAISTAPPAAASSTISVAAGPAPAPRLRGRPPARPLPAA